MKRGRAGRKQQQANPIPFESYSEIPALRWPPNLVYVREVARAYLEDYFGERISDEQAEVRGANFFYRLAFPKDCLGYPEALERVWAGDDDTLFKLVRLFGREVEKREWFLHREAQAHQDRDARFFSRYNEARKTSIDWQKSKQHLRRLFLLSIFEPELREQKSSKILAFLHAWYKEGWLSQEELPPSPEALRTYLSSRFGWKKR